MQREGRTSSPDVDTFDPNIDPGSSRVIQDHPDNTNQTDIESPPDADPIPLPPDVEKRQPVEEPEEDGVPVGDVNDSPKRILDAYN